MVVWKLHLVKCISFSFVFFSPFFPYKSGNHTWEQQLQVCSTNCMYELRKSVWHWYISCAFVHISFSVVIFPSCHTESNSGLVERHTQTLFFWIKNFNLTTTTTTTKYKSIGFKNINWSRQLHHRNTILLRDTDKYFTCTSFLPTIFFTGSRGLQTFFYRSDNLFQTWYINQEPWICFHSEQKINAKNISSQRSA